MLHINNIYWGVPFCLVLIALTIAPILIPKIWHNHFGKIIFGLSLSFLLPYYYIYGSESTLYVFLQCMIHDYIPFLAMVGSLYIVSSNINIVLPFNGTPLSNTMILSFGTLAGSVMGTMGASSVLIRPIIEMNKNRKYKSHIFIFFIFLVSNIGGCFSTLGDPPIFLGYVNGIPFLWATEHLFAPTIFVSLVLLVLFYIYESFVYRREAAASEAPKAFVINGWLNVIFAILIPTILLFIEWWGIDVSFKFKYIEIFLKDTVRDICLVLIGLISYLFSSNKREDYLHPIGEVAKVFFGVIVTIYPLMIMLEQGKDGPLGYIIRLLDNDIISKNEAYFWLSGIFSVFLDNAPTYLVLFSSVGVPPEILSGAMSKTLVAISTSSVYFGALSYIGNSPNYMVKSVLTQHNVKMPGFFTYMLIACGILLPIFAIVSKVFI